MDEDKSHMDHWLAERFEANRSHLRAVAFRMLGSLSEAEDAVQEGWLRVQRSQAEGVENLGGWLTTVIAHICLDMLRTRKSRREDSLDEQLPETVAAHQPGIDPEQEALLADSVGLALLVVLETLTPAERLAFVLHDLFAVPFDEIAPIVGRTPAAARQIASRARRRVQGTPPLHGSELAAQREVVDAFLIAARGGDFGALLAILDPNVVLHSDTTAARTGTPREMQGAVPVANRVMRGGARATQPALINGGVGVVIAPQGRLLMVLTFTIRDGKIIAIDAIGDPERLRELDLATLS